MRTAQKHAALSELLESDAPKVSREKRPVKIEPLDEHDVQRPGASADPLSQLEDAEMAAAITSAIDQLPPAQRHVAVKMRRSLSEGKPLRHYYRTDRQYKTAHGRWPAARVRLAKLLRPS